MQNNGNTKTPVYGPGPATYTAVPTTQQTPGLMYHHQDKSKRDRKSQKYPSKYKWTKTIDGGTINPLGSLEATQFKEGQLTALETLESYIPITWVKDYSKSIHTSKGGFLVYNCTVDGLTFEGEGTIPRYAKENAAIKALTELEFPDVDLNNIKQEINHRNEEQIFELVVRDYYRKRRNDKRKKIRLDEDDNSPPPEKRIKKTVTPEPVISEPVLSEAVTPEPTASSSNIEVPSSSTTANKESQDDSTEVLDLLNSKSPESEVPVQVPHHVIEMFTKKYGQLEPESGFKYEKSVKDNNIFTLKCQGSIFIGMGSTRKAAKRDAAKRAWIKFERQPPPEVLRSDVEMAAYEKKLMAGSSSELNRVNKLKQEYKLKQEEIIPPLHSQFPSQINNYMAPSGSENGTTPTPFKIGQGTGGMQSDLTEKIVRSCFRHVNKQLSKHGLSDKVTTRQLCCIVKVDKSDAAHPFQVVAHGGGNSVVDPQKLQAQNNKSAKKDWTGPSLAVRAFRTWLAAELVLFFKRKYTSKKSYIFVQDELVGKVQIKPELEFHMVCNSAPAGDATRKWQVHRGVTYTSADPQGMVQFWSLPQLWDGQEAPESRLVYLPKNTDTSRTHSGIMSPCAKLAIRSVTGIQGALLSIFIPKPIYITQYYIRAFFDKTSLHRALYSRAKLPDIDSPEPGFSCFYRLCLPDLCYDLDQSYPNIAKASKRISGSSFAWHQGYGIEELTLTEQKEGPHKSLKGSSSVKPPSVICSGKLLHFLRPYLPQNLKHMQYKYLKTQAYEYQKLKRRVKDSLIYMDGNDSKPISEDGR